MKNHKFWAWALVFCLFMTIYTGYKISKKKTSQEAYQLW